MSGQSMDLAVSREAAVSTAREIGEQLIASAIWAGDRCTFLGDSLTPCGDHIIVYQTTNAGLYEGTAGIARFLAFLDQVEPNEPARKTANAALQQALALAAGPGLYEGAPGIALVALELAKLWRKPSLARLGAELLRHEIDTADENFRSFDLMHGHAGLVLALSRAGSHLDNDEFVAAAQRLAERLMTQGRRRAQGWSWPAGPDWEMLDDSTGLAHGASGVAMALEELHACDSDPRWAEAAFEARRYERSWFSERDAAWLDLRRTDPARLACAHHWCHGSVGIAFDRLGAVNPDPLTRLEAEIALDAVIRDVLTIAGGPVGPGAGFAANVSLCHGLGGALDVLVEGITKLQRHEDVAVAARIAAFGSAEKVARGAWRCGLQSRGETPGLMVGLAGIGMAYLRLAEPLRVPPASLPPLPRQLASEGR